MKVLQCQILISNLSLNKGYVPFLLLEYLVTWLDVLFHGDETEVLLDEVEKISRYKIEEECVNVEQLRE